MNRLRISLSAALLCLAAWTPASAGPSVGETTVLGPFAGPRAALHPDNLSPPIALAGTDLGWSYVHRGELRFLFGDTQARVDGAAGIADPIDPDYGDSPYQFDDAFGSVDLGVYGDAGAFPASGQPGFPLISMGQHPGEANAMALNPGHWLDAFKTPFGGWSNGTDEYAIFYTFKPMGCAEGDAVDDLSCDTGLGSLQAEGLPVREAFDEVGFTFPCVDGSPGCVNETMRDDSGAPVAGSGFYVDRGSTIYAPDALGRTLGVARRLLIGVRNRADPRQYDGIVEWVTNRFQNISVASVQDFRPANGSDEAGQDYNVAGDSGSHRRIFLWGRPGFIGVGASDRRLGLYFAYVDMPAGDVLDWEVRYYTGTESGVPQFSPNEADAAALDLDSESPGIQTDEVHDNVFLENIVWVDHLRKWVMFYGGGVVTSPVPPLSLCGAVELFTGPECREVDLGNSAIRMRTADDPWGPWSPPQDVFEPGDPAASPPTGQYADNGMLYHPDCEGENCAPRYDHPASTENTIGVLYAPIIHAPWIEAVGDDVDLIWSVSTANPYGVSLLRTRIEGR